VKIYPPPLLSNVEHVDAVIVYILKAIC